MYRKISNRMEYWTKVLHILLIVARIGYILLPVSLSIYEYVSSGYSNESFQQIYPAMYVLWQLRMV